MDNLTMHELFSYLMPLRKQICVSWKDFCYWSICRLFRSIFHKICWRKITKKFLEAIFLGTHSIQKVPKHVWIEHCWNFLCINRHVEVALQFCKLNVYKLIGVKMTKRQKCLMYLYMRVYVCVYDLDLVLHFLTISNNELLI